MNTEKFVRASDVLQKTCEEIGKRIVGQEEVIRHMVAALVAGGHVLLQDVPGTGKTTLAKALAEVTGMMFARIQGTPDLMPSDVVGTMVYHPGTGEFSFRKGPVFTELLLVDEINRATPRSQSALLEAMAEKQVTVDGRIHPMSDPFFVIATANPIESQGVFPLPEAQLDRFLIQLKLGYGSAEQEFQLVRRIGLAENSDLRPQMSSETLKEIKNTVSAVAVNDDIVRYIVHLCRATRRHEQILLGASPRAVLLLTQFAQALALTHNRWFVLPDDVQEAFRPVMQPRLSLRVEWNTDGQSTELLSILDEILSSVHVPAELSHEG